MSDNFYPLPADEIGALYEVKTHELILFAKGKSQPITSKIHFKRLPLLCGLKFELEGRVLAIMGKPRPYSIEKRFKMPPPTNPYVIVVYAGDLKGKPIPIHFTGFIPPGIGEESDSSTKQEPPELPQTQALENEKISVICGCTSSPKYLELQTAGIEDKNIYWKFKAIRLTQDTQISLYFSGGIAQYVYRKVYDVSIGLGDERVVKPGEDGCNPTFIDQVTLGINTIKEKYADAKLHKVDASPPVPGPCDNPGDLSNLTIYCTVNEGKQLASVSIGGFDPLHIYLHEKTPDDRRDFEQWPIKMDIVDADELIKQKDITQDYTGATLDYSFLPCGDNEPDYTFNLVPRLGGPRGVRVGVFDGKVTPFGQPLPPNGS